MLETIARVMRGLAADGVEKANSGHPGMPLGCAEIGTVLYTNVLRHDPTQPDWPDRDRFILSAGHGSMFLYSFLHLTGYDLPMEELKRFRQLGAPTAGHPEYGMLPGVETTTGPLGQGFANAVGFALAERILAARFNRPGYEIVNHYTYCLAGDGCLMEGVASEAASLAGHLGLGKLIVIYDDNRISIEGSTDLAFTEDVAQRFLAYGWHVLEIDGHDFDAITRAIEQAKAVTDRPTLIKARTIIGKYSNKAGSEASHGAPLGAEGVAQLKKTLGLPDEEFYVPDEVYEFFAERRKAWRAEREAWEARFEAWSQAYPELRREWDAAMNNELPADLVDRLPKFEVGSKAATRQSSGQVLQRLAEEVPYLVGGSADLAPSTNTLIKASTSIQRGQFEGKNLHFGVREHAMGAILNGLHLHGGLRVFGATFLAFADYMRPPIRLAALMKIAPIFVFTHDSIYLGEDGPTHQPVEQLESLRIIPNMRVFRPADGEEVRYAWVEALKRTDGPTALILSRQGLPVVPRIHGAGGTVRGGYVVYESEGGSPQVVLVGSGSEVSLCYQAAELLEKEGVRVRIVSMPSRELFAAQSEEYRNEVLPPGVPRVFVEAGVETGWHSLAQPGDGFLCLNTFGESGPGNEVAAHFGFTPENLARIAQSRLQRVGA